MKKTDPKEIAMPAVALFIICFISTLLLGGTNLLTKDKIALVAAEKAENARKSVCAEAVTFTENQVEVNGQTYTVYTGLDGENKVVGYTVSALDKSYGGAIEVMTGFDTELKITGVEILTIDDTPGLGMNAKKDSFRDQFKGKTGELTASKSPTQDNEIQAMTGATITSKAVTRCVSAAYKAVQTQIETGGEK